MATAANNLGAEGTDGIPGAATAGGAATAWTGIGQPATAGVVSPALAVPLTVLTGRPTTTENAGPGPAASVLPEDSAARKLPDPAPERAQDPAADVLAADLSAGSDAAPPADQAGLPAEATSAVQELTAPPPADLLTEFLPFDRASVEAAIDQFLGQFEGLGVSLLDLSDSSTVVSGLATLAVATAAAGLVIGRRRYYGEKPRQSEDAEAALERFTSLSGLWKLGAT
jgi:hypothetical protein